MLVDTRKNNHDQYRQKKVMVDIGKITSLTDVANKNLVEDQHQLKNSLD